MPALSRRSLITGLISLVAAPAIVRAGNLMPVKVMEPSVMLLDQTGFLSRGRVLIESAAIVVCDDLAYPITPYTTEIWDWFWDGQKVTATSRDRIVWPI